VHMKSMEPSETNGLNLVGRKVVWGIRSAMKSHPPVGGCCKVDSNMGSSNGHPTKELYQPVIKFLFSATPARGRRENPHTGISSML
jgi:hypothetical protein